MYYSYFGCLRIDHFIPNYVNIYRQTPQIGCMVSTSFDIKQMTILANYEI